MVTTPKLGVNLLATNTVNKEVVINEGFVTFDALIARVAKSISNTPPAEPQDGDVYIVGTSPINEWNGYANHIAFWFNGWHLINPPDKIKMWVESTGSYWTKQTLSWTEDPAGTPSALNDLTDVSGNTPDHGDFLMWDQTAGKWVPAPLANPDLEIGELSNVVITNAEAGQALVYDSIDGVWRNQTISASGGASTLAQLNDVDMSGADEGHVPYWDGEKLKFKSPQQVIPLPHLRDLPDVYVNHLLVGDVLAWNGAAWVPSQAAVTYSFLGMVDGPQTFEGNANKFLVVDPTESELVFKSLDDLINISEMKLIELADTPNSYGNQGQVLVVNSNKTGFVFASMPPTITVKVGGSTITTELNELEFEGLTVTSSGSGKAKVKFEMPPIDFPQIDFRVNDQLLADPIAINFTGAGVVAVEDEENPNHYIVTIDSGGGALHSLEDVDFSEQSPQDGHTLVYDALKGKWKPGQAAGSVGVVDGTVEPALYEFGPFAPPRPNMFPDRFNAPSAIVMDIKNRGMVVQPGSQPSGVKHCLVSRSLINTIAPWQVTARVAPTGFEAGGHAGGIAIQRAANGAMVFLVLGNSNSDTQYSIRFGYVNASGAETIVTTEPNHYQWLRLVFDGNNIRAYVSYDGLIWHQFGQVSAATVLGGAPNKVAIDNRVQSATTGEVGVLVTYWDDPDFPAETRTRQGVVNVTVGGLQDVDLGDQPLEDGQALVWDADRQVWTAGNPVGGGGPGGPVVGELDDLTDVDTSNYPPQHGQALVWDEINNVWRPGAQVGGQGPVEVDISCFIPGEPEADEIVARFIAVRSLTLPSGFMGSKAFAQEAPSNTVIFNVAKNGSVIGTIQFDADENEGVFASLDGATLDAGDRLDIVSPPNVYGISDIGITFAGSR